MSDYTPTTEDARKEYLIAREGIEPTDEVIAQFDRWLAEEKAKAWEEGAHTVYQENDLVGGVIPANPYRGENK